MRLSIAFVVGASLAFAMPAFADNGLRAELTRKANAGDADAMVELFYDFGYGDPGPDKTEAEHWLDTAAKAGNADAEFAKGQSLEPVGEGGDNTQAVAWLKKAAAQGHGGAMIELIWLDRDFEDQYSRETVTGAAALQWAFQDLQHVSNAADIEADEADMARWQEQGFGDGVAEWRAQFHVDLDKAQSNEPGSAQQVARAYLGGVGVKPDKRAAEHWYQIAADSGELGDQMELADRYFNGDLGDNRRAMASVYYARAAAILRPKANAGDDGAQVQLAGLYLDAKLDPPDHVAQAVKWYQRAADAGNTEAFRALSVLYLEGKGVPKNASQAIYWLTRAANNNGKRLKDDDQADVVSMDQWVLSGFYFEGKVVPRNDYLALYWLELASANHMGDVSTDNMTLEDNMLQREETLKKRLTPAQVERVYAAAAKWKKAFSVSRN